MAGTKEPWLKLFTGDILADEELKSCSSSARGVFLYFLALMHRSKKRGYLASPSGKPWTIQQLHRNIGIPEKEIESATKELLHANVFSTEVIEGETFIYSRRMVREADISNKRSEAGRIGMAKRYQTVLQNDNNTDNKRPNIPLASGSSSDSSLEGDARGNQFTLPLLASDAAFIEGWPGSADRIAKWHRTFEDLLGAGFSLESLAVELNRKPRKTEPPWDFYNRLIPKVANGKQPGTSQSLGQPNRVGVTPEKADAYDKKTVRISSAVSAPEAGKTGDADGGEKHCRDP